MSSVTGGSKFSKKIINIFIVRFSSLGQRYTVMFKKGRDFFCKLFFVNINIIRGFSSFVCVTALRVCACVCVCVCVCFTSFHYPPLKESRMWALNSECRSDKADFASWLDSLPFLSSNLMKEISPNPETHGVDALRLSSTRIGWKDKNVLGMNAWI